MKISPEKNFDMFNTFAQNIDCGYMLEPPHVATDEYPQSMFWSKNKKDIPLHTPVLLYESGVQGGYTCYGHVLLVTR